MVGGEGVSTKQASWRKSRWFKERDVQEYWVMEEMRDRYDQKGMGKVCSEQAYGEDNE